MIVTIDGPAGAGKSSAARTLARRLGFQFLDTGAMYRAVAWEALQRGISWDDEAGLARLAETLALELDDDRVFVAGRDVTRDIRTTAVTAAVKSVADNPAVRRHLVTRQRALAGRGNYVTEGRDQGTVVFPDARCKIYLTASAAERARRRWQDLVDHGESVSLEEVLAHQEERDRRDAERTVGPLRPADDAVHVVTDGLSPEQVVDQLEAIVRHRWPTEGQ